MKRITNKLCYKISVQDLKSEKCTVESCQGEYFLYLSTFSRVLCSSTSTLLRIKNVIIRHFFLKNLTEYNSIYIYLYRNILKCLRKKESFQNFVL